MKFLKNDLVRFDSRPYIVIRPDSGNWFEIYPGSTLDGLTNDDRGHWADGDDLTPRTLEDSSAEELALGAIWNRCRKGDWSNAMLALLEYRDKVEKK